MTGNELIHKLRERVSNILPDFKFKKVPGGCSFSRPNRLLNRVDILGFSINNYGNQHSLNSIYTGIAFNEVEDIVNPLLVKYKLFDKAIINNSTTVSVSMGTKNTIGYDFLINSTIQDDESFEKVFDPVTRLIHQDVLPFFLQYSNLGVLANKLAELSPKEILPFIFGPQLFLKTVAILCLANHTKYEARKNEFFEELKTRAANDNGNSYALYFGAFQELIDKLHEEQM
jgi:hypothetical protein